MARATGGGVQGGFRVYGLEFKDLGFRAYNPKPQTLNPMVWGLGCGF